MIITEIILFALLHYHWLHFCLECVGMQASRPITAQRQGSWPLSRFMNGSVNEQGTRCGMFNLNHAP